MDNKTSVEIDKNGIPTYLRRKKEKETLIEQNIDLKRSYIPQSYKPLQSERDPEALFQQEMQKLIDDLQSIEFDPVENGYYTQEVDSFIKLTISGRLSRLDIDDNLIEMIEEHDFRYRKSGYDPVQVDNYLDSVCESIEGLMRIREYNVVKLKQIDTSNKRSFGDYGGYSYRKNRNLPENE